MSQSTIVTARQPGATMADLAYEQLCHMLLTLRIAPGDPIREDELIQELNIGRTPLREALKRLEIDKLVVSYPKRGTFAKRVEISDLGYITEIRQALEPMAAARAARTANEETREQLRCLAREIEERDITEHSIEDLLTFDSKVHRSIYSASGNPHLEDSLVRYNNLGMRIWCTVANKLPHLNDHIQEHLELLEAVINGNEDRAAQLSEEHVRTFANALREALLSY